MNNRRVIRFQKPALASLLFAAVAAAAIHHDVVNVSQTFQTIDNFGASDIPLGSAMTLSTALQQVPESVSLSALATQAGTVTFRLYGYNDTKQSSAADSAGLANRTTVLTGTGGNLIIGGTVSVVPEPSS